jgi:hypothetical protein
LASIASIDSPSVARSLDLGTHFMEAFPMRTAMAAPAIVVCGLAGDGASGGRATERTTNDGSALRHAVPGSLFVVSADSCPGLTPPV